MTRRRVANRAEQGRRGAPTAETPETVRVCMLGGFSVSVGARDIQEGQWRLRKAAGLVKLLALAPNHRMHRERMMDLLWPQLGKKAAANNLSQALHAARRILDPGLGATSLYLTSRGEQLVLCPGGQLWVDVEAFEEAAATARRTREPAAYRAALELYVGDFLPGDLYEDWAEGRREGLRRLFLSLLVELSNLHEERGEYDVAAEVLRRVVAEEPTHEEAHVGLMRLHAFSGRRREALEQYEQLEEVLSRELVAEPAAASRLLYEEIASGRFPPPRPGKEGHLAEEPPDEGRHNLPAARTSFVGRERELLEVKRGLAMGRLLTLTGAGGSGKTRLALEVAKDLAGAYPDGVWLVELAPIAEPELVMQAVASVLEVSEAPDRSLTDTIVDALREKTTLLVLDNCEHLLDTAARLADTLLDSCPRLRVLATSREALGVPGEAVRPVGALSLPDPARTPTVEGLEGCESARLFCGRARYRSPDFALTTQNALAVAEVCRRLGGLPLAIELAAARVGVLSVEQILARLENSLKLLTGGGRTAQPRHRTLRGTLDWSFDLLEEQERKLFGRLSVFAGGFTLEAAEAVGAGDGIEKEEVVDLLSGLVDKSLVVAETGSEGAARYKMLEPVRQYGQEKLDEIGEAEAVLGRHAALFLALAEQAAPKLRGARQVAWLERLDREEDNLRAAVAWLLGRGEPVAAVRLGWALWRFWALRGRLTEGRRRMEEALAKGSTMPAASRAKALFVAGTMADLQRDRWSAQQLLEESLALFRESGDKRGAAYALGSAGLVAIGQDQLQRGIAFFEEGIDLLLEVGDRWDVAFMTLFLGVGWLRRGDHARAKRMAERGLALSREIGDRHGTSIALCILAGLAQAKRDHERAKWLFEEGLKLSAEVEAETIIAYCLEGLANAAGADGRVVHAARLWGAAEALLEKIEDAAHIYAPDRSVYQSQVAAARDALGEEAYAAAWVEGQAMTTGQL